MRTIVKCGVLTTLQATSMLLAAGAQAQADPCDQLKGELAARIEASGVRGYSLETVPGSAPVPPDAKVIGTCLGGASKVLYRRWGATRPSSGAVGAARPASAAKALVVPHEQARRVPGVQVEAVRVLDPAVAPPVQVALDKPLVAKVPLARQVSDFMAENWRWVGALIFLPIAGGFWAWRAHRSAYDEAGLPRGPRITVR